MFPSNQASTIYCLLATLLNLIETLTTMSMLSDQTTTPIVVDNVNECHSNVMCPLQAHDRDTLIPLFHFATIFVL